MRPLYLSIENYGSFVKKQVIDFEHDLQSGVFLISGITGSGKSTIFDAICVALYGAQASSNYKSQSVTVQELVNRSSKKKTATIEFTFQHQNERYTVIRKISKNSSSVLRMPDGKEITKEVNTTIEKLLGLTSKQFKQVVLLPQGQFQEFLLSKHDNKQELLRNIFETSYYHNFKEVLVNKFKTQKEQLNAFHQEKRFRDEKISEYEQQYGKLEVVKEREIKLSQEINDLEKEYQKLRKQQEEQSLLRDKQKELKNKKAELHHFIVNQEQKLNEKKRLKEELEEYKELIEQEEQVRSLKEERSRLEKTQKEAIEEFIKIKSEYNQAEKENNAIPNLEKQREDNNYKLEELRNKQRKIAEQLEKWQEYKQLEKERERLNQEINTIEQKIDQLIQKQKSKESFLEQLDQITLEKKNIEEELAQLVDKKNKINQIFIFQQNYADKQQRINDLDGVIQKQKQEQIEFEKKYDKMSKEYLDNLLSVVANELVANEPCPVCGSKHHPHPHQKIKQEQISLQTLREIKEKIKQVQDKINRTETDKNKQVGELIALKIKIEEFKEFGITKEIYYQVDSKEKVQQELFKQQELQINVLEKKIAEIGSTEELMTKCQKEKQSKISQLAVINSKLQEFNSIEITPNQILEQQSANKNHQNELKIEQDKIKTKIEKIREGYRLVAKKYHEQDGKLTEIKQNMTELEKKHNFAEDVLIKQKENLPRKVNLDKLSLEINNFEKIIQDIEQLEAKKQQLIEGITKLEEELANKEILDKDELNITDEQLSLRIKNLSLEHGKLQDVKEQYQKLLNEQEKMIQANQANLKKLEILNKLVDVMKDESLEEFVQRQFLKRTLNRANLYLTKLLEGRYYFEVELNLKIKIFDNYTQSLRDPLTLSGGETFLASLALALGLSAVISEQASQTNSEMILIDEGFGSLDQESLTKVLEVLDSLQQEGQLVGLISHVDLLQETIPKQIKVNKDLAGSKLTLVYH